jgi:hypothetical protein
MVDISNTPVDSEEGVDADVPSLQDAASTNPDWADFLAIWKVREAQREPGEPEPAEGAVAPCFECVSNARDCDVILDNCFAGRACIARNCLCMPSQQINGQACLAHDYPSDLELCVLDCFGFRGAECLPGYAENVACVVKACRAACL